MLLLTVNTVTPAPSENIPPNALATIWETSMLSMASTLRSRPALTVLPFPIYACVAWSPASVARSLAGNSFWRTSSPSAS